MEEVEPGKQYGPAEEESTEVEPRLERSNGSEPDRTGSGGGDRRLHPLRKFIKERL